MKIIDLKEEYKSSYLVCLEDWSDEIKEAGSIKEKWYDKMKEKGPYIDASPKHQSLQFSAKNNSDFPS